MRSVLTWIVFGLIPSSEEQWLISTVLKLIAFPLWFAGVTYFSMMWSSKLDGWAGWFAQWTEEIMMGKNSFLDSMNGFVGQRANVNCCAHSHGNGHISDLRVSEKEKFTV